MEGGSCHCLKLRKGWMVFATGEHLELWQTGGGSQCRGGTAMKDGGV